MERFDIAIIGSGPAGYVAAIRSSQLGYKTALVEKYSSLGGTCTNVGCIPTKSLLDSTHHYFDALHNFETHGINIEKIQLNFEKLYKRKNDVVIKNTEGLDFLMKKNSITVINGSAKFLDNNSLEIENVNQEKIILTADKFIIATGSKPASIRGIEIDKKRIITSTEALSLNEQPKSIVIIGGGVIGVELASIFNRIGTQVTILEYADNLIANMDTELGKNLHKILLKEGVKINLQQSVYKVENLGHSAKVWFKNKDGQEQELESEFVLVAAGRKPYTDKLGLENTNVKLNPDGTIITNEDLQTTAPNIFAIGDVIGGLMLAHKAEEEAVFVVEKINGQKPHINYNRIPSVVYTSPEIASVGFTEEELKKKGIEYNIGKFPFLANEKANMSIQTNGFIKVLIMPNTGEVLGIHIIDTRAADIIAQAVVGLEYEVKANEMLHITYAHQTHSEALKKAYKVALEQNSIKKY